MDAPGGRSGSSVSHGPVGLLSAANADLYHRFEAEEARTNHLRAKEKQQTLSLASLTSKLDELNKSLTTEEEQCAARTIRIKEELDELDREEALVDAQIKSRKRQLQAMTAAVADIKIQLAYNFTPTLSGGRVGESSSSSSARGSARKGSMRGMSTPSGSAAQSGGDTGSRGIKPAAAPPFNVVTFSETLTDEEMAEIVGESTFVDEHGVAHRVIFTEAADGEDAEGAAASPTRSYSRGSTSRLGGNNERSSSHRLKSTQQDRLSQQTSGSKKDLHPHWLQTPTAKRAAFMLLEDSRRLIAEQLRDVETQYHNGAFLVDAEYQAQVVQLEKKLESLTSAIRGLLSTTPTSLKSNLEPRGSMLFAEASTTTPFLHNVASQSTTSSSSSPPKSGASRGSKRRFSQQAPLAPEVDEEAVAISLAKALGIAPNAAPDFVIKLDKQRQELATLRCQIEAEEKLTHSKHTVDATTWIQECRKRDMEEFATSRQAEVEPERHGGGGGLAQGLPMEQGTARGMPTPRPPSAKAPSSSASRKPSKEEDETTNSKRVPGTIHGSDAAPRPSSASRMGRYATAASRVLRGQGMIDASKYESRYLALDASAAEEYHFSSHGGLSRAIASRGVVPRRERVEEED